MLTSDEIREDYYRDTHSYKHVPLEVVGKKYMYDYPRPSVTTDVVLFYTNPETTQNYVLLIKRGNKTEACSGMWALPGGYMEIDETLKHGASRELHEETGINIDKNRLRLVGVYDGVHRDTRGRVLTVAYYIEVHGLPEVKPQAEFSEEVEDHIWISVSRVFNDNSFELAFDHKTILEDAYTKLRSNYVT